MSLLESIQSQVKDAMRAKDTMRLGVLRMAVAAIKQKAIDAQIDPAALSAGDEMAILEKMVKQRRDAESQFRAGDRADLADKEAAEAEILQSFLPKQLSDAEQAQLVDEVLDALIAGGQPAGPSLMGPAMGRLKAKVEADAPGRVDMAVLSKRLKDAIAARS